MSAEVDSVYFPHAEVVGDIGNALWQIKEKCEPQGHWDHSFFERCKAVQEEKVYRGVHTTAPAFPMNIQRVVQDLRTSTVVYSSGLGPFNMPAKLRELGGLHKQLQKTPPQAAKPGQVAPAGVPDGDTAVLPVTPPGDGE